SGRTGCTLASASGNSHSNGSLLSSKPVRAGTAHVSPEEEARYRLGASIIGAVVLLCGGIGFFGTKEIAASHAGHVPRSCLGHRPYRLLMLSFMLSSLAIQTVQKTAWLLYTIYSLKMKPHLKFAIAVVMVTAILVTPLVVQFVPQYYATMVVAGCYVSINMLLPWIMLPDVIDDYTVSTAVAADEAAFYSLYVFFNKFAVASAPPACSWDFTSPATSCRLPAISLRWRNLDKRMLKAAAQLDGLPMNLNSLDYLGSSVRPAGSLWATSHRCSRQLPRPLTATVTARRRPVRLRGSSAAACTPAARGQRLRGSDSAPDPDGVWQEESGCRPRLRRHTVWRGCRASSAPGAGQEILAGAEATYTLSLRLVETCRRLCAAISCCHASCAASSETPDAPEQASLAAGHKLQIRWAVHCQAGDRVMWGPPCCFRLARPMRVIATDASGRSKRHAVACLSVNQASRQSRPSRQTVAMADEQLARDRRASMARLRGPARAARCSVRQQGDSTNHDFIIALLVAMRDDACRQAPEWNQRPNARTRAHSGQTPHGILVAFKSFGRPAAGIEGVVLVQVRTGWAAAARPRTQPSRRQCKARPRRREQRRRRSATGPAWPRYVCSRRTSSSTWDGAVPRLPSAGCPTLPMCWARPPPGVPGVQGGFLASLCHPRKASAAAESVGDESQAPNAVQVGAQVELGGPGAAAGEADPPAEMPTSSSSPRLSPIADRKPSSSEAATRQQRPRCWRHPVEVVNSAALLAAVEAVKKSVQHADSSAAAAAASASGGFSSSPLMRSFLKASILDRVRSSRFHSASSSTPPAPSSPPATAAAAESLESSAGC
uniref:Aa_trans domain-containing protein n=1 Tax=Macrostomum lignano TaxID=282301 RepID=A0A1I8FDY6_9PLAT